MELWDIYDADKRPTGRTMRRNDFCLAEGEYHLTVLGVVARRDGRFLITKRVRTKAWAPGWWEVSGGAAMAGEESLDAVRREVKEETGLDVTGWDGGYLFTYHRENPGEGDNYFVDVYRFIGISQRRNCSCSRRRRTGTVWPRRRKSGNWLSRESFSTMTVSRRRFLCSEGCGFYVRKMAGAR